MQLEFHQVDAFSSRPFSGNPAVVYRLDAWLADELMQMIATEHNLSETAFVVREGEAWRIRWFAPSVEVALCGHATLAAAHVLFEVYDEPGERLEFISRSGALRVNREDERLVLDFPAQYPSEVGSTVELEQALGLPPVDVLGSTDKLLVLLESEEAVRACRPDFAALARLPWRGVIVTARGQQKDFVSRFFAPAMGVDEDPVTGSAHCSLIPYWAQRLNKLSLTAQQCSARRRAVVPVGGRAGEYRRACGAGGERKDSIGLRGASGGG